MRHDRGHYSSDCADGVPETDGEEEGCARRPGPAAWRVNGPIGGSIRSPATTRHDFLRQPTIYDCARSAVVAESLDASSWSTRSWSAKSSWRSPPVRRASRGI